MQTSEKLFNRAMRKVLSARGGLLDVADRLFVPIGRAVCEPWLDTSQFAKIIVMDADRKTARVANRSRRFRNAGA